MTYINEAIKDYEESCDFVANAFLIHYEYDQNSEFTHWVGGDIGGVFAASDSDFFSVKDMVFALKEGLTYKEISEWFDWNLDKDDVEDCRDLDVYIRFIREKNKPIDN